jgi:type IV pilus assembly protein PilA
MYLNPSGEIKMKSMKIVKKAQAGFTLIELMIVVAIIGILAAVALPAYQDYTVRGRVSELAIMGSSMKATVTENIASSGGTVDADSCKGIVDSTTSTKNMESYTCASGVITVTGTSPAAAGVILTYTPTVNADNVVVWTCTSAEASHKYVPSECRNV